MVSIFEVLISSNYCSLMLLLYKFKKRKKRYVVFADVTCLINWCVKVLWLSGASCFKHVMFSVKNWIVDQVNHIKKIIGMLTLFELNVKIHLSIPKQPLFASVYGIKKRLLPICVARPLGAFITIPYIVHYTSNILTLSSQAAWNFTAF